MNTLKRFIFHLWFILDELIPISRGKHRISLILFRIFGTAKYKIDEFYMFLHPHEFFWRNFKKNALTDQDVKDQILENLNSGDIFIDIGANIGYFTLTAAVECDALVFAFEPSKREISRLYENILVNKVENRVTIFPFGIASDTQVLNLNISPAAHPGMNSVVDLHEVANVQGRQQAFFFKLGGLLTSEILQRTRLIKIDVEGYEPQVLDGLADSMKELNDATFIVEISPNYLVLNGFKKEYLYDFFERFDFHPLVGKNNSGQYNEIFKKNTKSSQTLERSSL